MSRAHLFASLLVLLGLTILSSAAWAQSGASASSSASFGGRAVEVRVGGFVFEAGSRVALEFTRDDSADCFGPNVAVHEVQLLDAGQQLVHRIVYDPPVGIDVWLGRIELLDPDRGPLPIGQYSLAVTTSVGSFFVDLELAATSRLYVLGRYSATASVCGISLRVYRLLTELDHGSSLTLRVGDRLLIALEGNPTTGYEWLNTLLYEFATLREIREVEFRPDSSLLGAGGLFLFRYEAVAPGPQAFRLAYQRPWESAGPSKLVEITVNVR